RASCKSLGHGENLHANLFACCLRGLWPRLIAEARREELQKYITGIVTRKGQKLIAIYCMPDHTHMLVGLTPNIAPSELIGDIKTDQLITSTSGDGSGVIFPGRKATGRFPCP